MVVHCALPLMCNSVNGKPKVKFLYQVVVYSFVVIHTLFYCNTMVDNLLIQPVLV